MASSQKNAACHHVPVFLECVFCTNHKGATGHSRRADAIARVIRRFIGFVREIADHHIYVEILRHLIVDIPIEEKESPRGKCARVIPRIPVCKQSGIELPILIGKIQRIMICGSQAVDLHIDIISTDISPIRIDSHTVFCRPIIIHVIV